MLLKSKGVRLREKERACSRHRRMSSRYGLVGNLRLKQLVAMRGDRILWTTQTGQGASREPWRQLVATRSLWQALMAK
eukprot:5198862-Pleurochrysis_carterae.AAC.1